MRFYLTLILFFIVSFSYSQDDVYYSSNDTTENIGNVYITNNYYNSDYYDYSYSSRIRRFSYPYYYSYYSDYYTNTYWYDYNPYSFGISIYLGYNWFRPINMGYYGYNWYSYGYNSYNYSYNCHSNHYNPYVEYSHDPKLYYTPRASNGSNHRESSSSVKKVDGHITHKPNQNNSEVITIIKENPFLHRNSVYSKINDIPSRRYLMVYH